MGQISEKGQKSQSFRWIGCARLVKMLRRVKVTDVMDGLDY